MSTWQNNATQQAQNYYQDSGIDSRNNLRRSLVGLNTDGANSNPRRTDRTSGTYRSSNPAINPRGSYVNQNQPRASATYQNQPRASATYQNQPRESATYQNQPRASATYQNQPRASATYQNQPRASATYQSQQPQQYGNAQQDQPYGNYQQEEQPYGNYQQEQPQQYDNYQQEPQYGNYQQEQPQQYDNYQQEQPQYYEQQAQPQEYHVAQAGGAPDYQAGNQPVTGSDGKPKEVKFQKFKPKAGEIYVESTPPCKTSFSPKLVLKNGKKAQTTIAGKKYDIFREASSGFYMVRGGESQFRIITDETEWGAYNKKRDYTKDIAAGKFNQSGNSKFPYACTQTETMTRSNPTTGQTETKKIQKGFCFNKNGEVLNISPQQIETIQKQNAPLKTNIWASAPAQQPQQPKPTQPKPTQPQQPKPTKPVQSNAKEPVEIGNANAFDFNKSDPKLARDAYTNYISNIEARKREIKLKYGGDAKLNVRETEAEEPATTKPKSNLTREEEERAISTLREIKRLEHNSHHNSPVGFGHNITSPGYHHSQPVAHFSNAQLSHPSHSFMMNQGSYAQTGPRFVPAQYGTSQRQIYPGLQVQGGYNTQFQTQGQFAQQPMGYGFQSQHMSYGAYPQQQMGYGGFQQQQMGGLGAFGQSPYRRF